MDSTPPYPLYNLTYSAYRLSPLYHGNSNILNDATLQSHARRMRNVLKGDNVRGVQVGLSTDTSVANLGPLETCTWDLIGDEASWQETHTAEEQDAMSDDLAPGAKHVSADTARGIHIQLEYAKTTHTALLLREPTAANPQPGFTSLPLLLIRMPQPLRDLVVDFLTTSFDTRIAPLKLRPQFLTTALESLLTHIEPSPQSIPDILKSLQIQLAFPHISPHLKSLDITIARDDIPDFLRRGHSLSRTAPFTAALALYLSSHLALRQPHLHSAIARITCGLFTLAADGKIKLSPPLPSSSAASSDSTSPTPSASELFMAKLYTDLVAEATSKIDFLAPREPARARQSKRSATTDSAARPMAKKRVARTHHTQDDELASADDAHTVRSTGTPARGSMPVDPPPPYELHDPAWTGGER